MSPPSPSGSSWLSPGERWGRVWGVPGAPLPLLGVLTKHPLAMAPAQAIPAPVVVPGVDEEEVALQPKAAPAWGQNLAQLQEL